MAKISLPATVTVAVFFFLFTLALARIPLKPLEKDDVAKSDFESSTLSEQSSVLSLPTAEIINAEESNQPIEPESLTVQSVPLDLATTRFRPINRRFYTRTKHPLRHCRHHYHLNRDDFFKMNSLERRDPVEIPYGDDMIYSFGENSDFEQPPTYSGVRRIPGRWVRLHHHHQPQNKDLENEGVTRMVFKRKNVDRLDREKKWKKHLGGENEKEKKDEKEKKSGSLMKSMRKFLDNYL